MTTNKKDWRKSPSERLHDLGMVAAYLYVAIDSLDNARDIAAMHGLLPPEKLAAISAAISAMDELEAETLSGEKVSAMHEATQTLARPREG